MVKLRKQQLIHSVMSYINLSLFTIIGITLLSIFFSFWMTEQADSDAHAINLSGTMRMQTYHIGLVATHSPKETKELIEKLDETWNHSLFTKLRNNTPDEALESAFNNGYKHWFNIVRPVLANSEKIMLQPSRSVLALLNKQVDLTDKLVNQLQKHAESKIRSLRTFQLFTMLVTTLVGSLIFYLLKNRVETPLSSLTDAARRIRDGNLQQHINIPGKDELAVLAKAFNQMSQSITETYHQLESRVEERTKELKRNNTILEYSFGVARKVLEDQDKSLDYQEVINDLSEVLMLSNVELCLFTPQGEHPYMQLDINDTDESLCTKYTCDGCRGTGPFNALTDDGIHYKYPVFHHDKQYGVIKVIQNENKPLLLWQQKLIQSSADQLAIALSLQETKEQERRLAMLSERTVMARELHDSLAQSLSYLKIQVTRLQKAQDKGKYEMQQPIIQELHEGLSSAYRHLRELLTTFRLQIDEEGLQGAIERTVKQLKERTDMDIHLRYSLNNIPLSPTEEIHLLQIMREASQNAINHSKGTRLDISIFQRTDKTIQLDIKDDGVGLSDNPEKLNHYGLAIIHERSRHLRGELVVKSLASGVKGTEIQLQFSPSYLKNKEEQNIITRA